MNLVSILLLAFALAADSFAVAVAKGSNLFRPTIGHALLLGAVFAAVQVAMPILGWRVGAEFRPIVQSYDHWIAFAILSVLGGRMVIGGLREEEFSSETMPFTLPALVLAAIATSIDSLVAGFGFGVLSLSIITILVAIGVVTFVTSVGGVYLGRQLGEHVGQFAEAGAGVILVALGFMILLSHLSA